MSWLTAARASVRTRALTALALLVPLAACSPAADSAKPRATAAGFPYTVTNCGVKTTFTAPPERAVTMNQHVTEVMLELGLKDRIAGTAYLDDAVLPEYAKDYESRPVLADEYPSYEKLLSANNEIITRAGGRNVFADLDKSFGDASWENVVERAPEVIVIYDYGAQTVAQKKKRLLEDPALADVPAIKNKRFAVLPLSDAVLGVRAPAAVEKLAEQLHPDVAR
ncbi:ABC transporter substrate-binding protein [Streptomyces sp. YC504]|uniref:ABC transporter substrate-binding protein n=1 Tax=Streptomyces mesophilus TaxID=1775132 RepID=A0A6G4XCQ7_9ACTN|nr:ABC transporter substrate-binding protein [Streptomyces mesophilus]NGO75178.1 ABC transporter substrate-binding protein [Streptomyces mesophilus]